MCHVCHVYHVYHVCCREATPNYLRRYPFILTERSAIVCSSIETSYAAGRATVSANTVTGSWRQCDVLQEPSQPRNVTVGRDNCSRNVEEFVKRCILHTNVLKYSIIYRNPVSQVEFHGEIQIIVPSWSDCLSLLVFACHYK